MLTQLTTRISQALPDDATIESQPEKLAFFNRTTEGFQQDIACCVTVKSVSAIQKLVHLANTLASDEQLAFTIHPVSTGQNWGYGSATPNYSSKPIVLVSLKELNKITYFDSNSGLCSVQPGVTQQQLFDYLTQHQAPFMVPVTGAGPSCSILSNALERGYGITPIADHFSSVTRIAGILPNGEYYHSSIADMDKSDLQLADKCYKWKLGPYLDGIFTQSGNMIVTEITLSLARTPQAFDSFYLRFYGENSFERAHESIQQIFKTLKGVVGGINLMDSTRVLAMVADNPQPKAAHKVMTDEQKQLLRQQNDVPDWTVVGTLYGSKRVVAAAKRDIKTSVKQFADKLFFSESKRIKLIKNTLRFLGPNALPTVRQQLNSLAQATAIMTGKPNEIALPLAYWRNPHISPSSGQTLNPAKDGCGLLWYAPLIPANIDAMKTFVEMVRNITVKFNIDPMITFTHTSEFNIDSTVPILFDLSNPDAVCDAHACLETLLNEGLKHGYVPYRLNISQQQSLNPHAISWKTAGIIANALDPNGIISPTRYNPAALSN